MKTTIILLDAESSQPQYEQIVAQIRMQIVASGLRSGDTLPSVRQLARDLDIAPNTVVHAYNALVHEGWLVTSARRGFMVAQHPPTLIAEERQRQLQRAVEQLLQVTEQLLVSPEELYAELVRQLNARQLQT